MKNLIVPIEFAFFDDVFFKNVILRLKQNICFPMGKLRAFIIELDNPQGVFFAGNFVSGRLHIELDAEMNMRGNFWT